MAQPLLRIATLYLLLAIGHAVERKPIARTNKAIRTEKTFTRQSRTVETPAISSHGSSARRKHGQLHHHVAHFDSSGGLKLADDFELLVAAGLPAGNAPRSQGIVPASITALGEMHLIAVDQPVPPNSLPPVAGAAVQPIIGTTGPLQAAPQGVVPQAGPAPAAAPTAATPSDGGGMTWLFMTILCAVLLGGGVAAFQYAARVHGRAQSEQRSAPPKSASYSSQKNEASAARRSEAGSSRPSILPAASHDSVPAEQAQSPMGTMGAKLASMSAPGGSSFEHKSYSDFKKSKRGQGSVLQGNGDNASSSASATPQPVNPIEPELRLSEGERRSRSGSSYRTRRQQMKTATEGQAVRQVQLGDQGGDSEESV